MHLNDMSLRQESRFFNEAGEVLDKARRGAFFDCSAIVADGQDSRLVSAIALASDVGLEGLDPVNATGLGQSRKRVVNRRRCDLWVRCLQPVQHIVGGNGTIGLL